MDRFRMEGVGEPAARQRISTNRPGQEATGIRAVALETGDGGDGRHPESHGRGVQSMISDRQKREQELDEEINSHLSMAEHERMDRGATPDEAHYAARREMGNVTLIKEVTRGMWGTNWMHTLLQDLRYGVRMLR